MAKFFNDNTPTYLGLTGLGLAIMLTLTACDGKKDKGEQDKTEKEDFTLETVEADAHQVCNDPKTQQQLNNALMSSLQKQAKTFAAAHAQTADFKLDLNEVANEASKVGVNIENIKAKDTAAETGKVACQASVSLQLSEADIQNANQMYAQSNNSSLEQKLAKERLSVTNGLLVDNNFSFRVDPQGNFAIDPVGNNQMLQIISDMMANSSLKSQIDGKLAAQQEAAQKRAQQQAAARRQAQAQVQAQQQAEAQRQAQLAAQRQEQRAAKQAKAYDNQESDTTAESKKKLSLASDGVLVNQFSSTTSVSNKSSATSSDEKNNNNQQPTSSNSIQEKPTEKLKVDVKGSDDVEMVIVEEAGTY